MIKFFKKFKCYDISIEGYENIKVLVGNVV